MKLQMTGEGTFSLVTQVVCMKKNNLTDEEIFVQFQHELGESMVREKLDFEKTASTGEKKRKKKRK